MRNTNEGGFRIELPGIPAKLRRLAEDDIRKLAHPIGSAAEQKKLPFMLRVVRITDSFQDDVNQLLQERAGPTGYVAARDNAHAIGRTLWFRSPDGDLGLAIVIDANKVNPWSLNNPDCLVTVLHELVHVLYEACRLKRLGEEEYIAGNDTAERMLDRWANLLVDEFDVDRQVDRLLQGLARKEDGQPWSLQELKEAQGEDWVQGLLDGLNQMPQVIDDSVWQYRIGQMGIQRLADGVIPYVNDLLTLAVHTASLYIGTDDWQGIEERIKETDSFNRFLKEHLDTILSQLDSSRRPLEESIQIVASAVEGIFQNCGLSFKTVPEGLYIAVGAPSR